MADTDCEIALRVCVGMQNFFFMLDQLRLSLGGHGLVSPVPCVIVTAPPGVMDRVALGKFERQNSISEPPYPPIGTAAPARGNAPAPPLIPARPHTEALSLASAWITSGVSGEEQPVTARTMATAPTAVSQPLRDSHSWHIVNSLRLCRRCRRIFQRETKTNRM